MRSAPPAAACRWPAGTLGRRPRVAHFLGVHAEQAIPLAMSLPSACGRCPAALYAVGTVALFVQALAGYPVLSE